MFARFLRRRARPRKAPPAPPRPPARIDADRAPARAGDDYDELDRRLMDTFPASDAVARYCLDKDEETREGERK